MGPGLYQFDYGYAPSVSVCNGVAVEVHEGNTGTLWYSMGAVCGNTVNWGASVQYDNGYNPSVLLCGSASAYLVEVHQATKAAAKSSKLWYHVAPYTSSTVTWNPAIEYGQGSTQRSESSFMILAALPMLPIRMRAPAEKLRGCITIWARLSFLDLG
jgi:hypothetical protein